MSVTELSPIAQTLAQLMDMVTYLEQAQERTYKPARNYDILALHNAIEIISDDYPEDRDAAYARADEIAEIRARRRAERLAREGQP